MRVESRYSKIVKLLSKDPFPLSPNLYLWNFTWRVAAGRGTPTAVQKQVYTYHKGSGRMRAEMKSESGPGRRRWDSRAAVVRPPHPNGEGHPPQQQSWAEHSVLQLRDSPSAGAGTLPGREEPLEFKG